MFKTFKHYNQKDVHPCILIIILKLYYRKKIKKIINEVLRSQQGKLPSMIGNL